MRYKRITLLCGHYGSGKTNIAVNMAFDLKNSHKNVAIADLDIVNPYFRTKDSAEEFSKRDIRLICSEYAGSNVDIPALPAEMYALTDDKSMMCVIDVGGDDRGALALGRLAPKILEENNYEMLLVVNRFRPLICDAASTVEVMREIECAAGIRFTGIVNNSNIGAETTKEDIEKTLERAEELSKKTGLPLVMTTVNEALFDKVSAPNKFSLKLQEKLF